MVSRMAKLSLLGGLVITVLEARTSGRAFCDQIQPSA